MANERTPLLKSGETEPIPSEVVIAPDKRLVTSYWRDMGCLPVSFTCVCCFCLF